MEAQANEGERPVPCSEKLAGERPVPCSEKLAGERPVPCGEKLAGERPVPCGERLTEERPTGKEKRLLFFDIDGTLAMPGYPPSEAVVRAMRSAREKGNLLILSTGRSAESVPPEVEEIGFDGYIYSAGGRIVMDGTELWSHTMSEDQVARIVDVLDGNEGVFFTLECDGGSFHSDVSSLNLASLGSDGGSTEFRRMVQYMENEPEKLLKNRRGQPVFKISFFCMDGELMDKFEKLLSPYGKVVRFGNLLAESKACAGEISEPGIDKGRALRVICEYCGVDVSRSVAFGDSMNDAEMLLAAGIGVAMGNAEPEVKKLADRICESVEEDGMARELERLGLV
jgi:Cof subfamily protein (haloacid dehalogenase superfamily)